VASRSVVATARPADPGPEDVGFCTECGKPLGQEHKFCGHCGHKAR
jgi:predicted amidophosphoribosyltransferase